jgi:hypothetical protein
VASLTNISFATWRLLRPWATKRTTSASRRVSPRPGPKARPSRLGPRRAWSWPGRHDQLDQALLDGRVEDGAAGGDVADRGEQRLAGHVFGQVADGARTQRGQHRIVVGVGGEDKDPGPGSGSDNPFGHLRAVQPGHAQVDQGDIRL